MPLPNGVLKSDFTNLSSPYQLYKVRLHLWQNLFSLSPLVINSSIQGAQRALFVCLFGFLLKSANEKVSMLKDLSAWSRKLAACPKVRTHRVLLLAGSICNHGFDTFFRPLPLPSPRCWGSPEPGVCLFSSTSSPWVIFYPWVSSTLYKLTPKSTCPAKLLSRAPISNCRLGVQGPQPPWVSVQKWTYSLPPRTSFLVLHPPGGITIVYSHPTSGLRHSSLLSLPCTPVTKHCGINLLITKPPS